MAASPSPRPAVCRYGVAELWHAELRHVGCLSLSLAGQRRAKFSPVSLAAGPAGGAAAPPRPVAGPRLLQATPPRYARDMAPVYARFATVVILDGSRLAAIAHRLKLLRRLDAREKRQRCAYQK
jgi:hypothetical protein